MNGEPLSHNHGYPARIIAPGIVGVRSVKWLDLIQIQLQESKNHYQQHDYKILPRNIDTMEAAEEVWEKVPALQEMPVNSAIGLPESDSTVERDENGMVGVRGYALPGYGAGPIVSVQVSGDDGKTWHEAELIAGREKGYQQSDLKWAWCLWQVRIEMERGKGQKIVSRATDKGGNSQNEAHSEWNLRGVAYNGYGEVDNLTVV